MISFVIAPYLKKTKKKLENRSRQRWGHEEEYEKEEVYFWIGGLIDMFSQPLVAYLKTVHLST